MTTFTKVTVTAALATALGLLVLQIIGGLEYTASGSLYTRASMIAAMITLAALPLFIEAARHARAGLIAGALGLAFACLLAYSLPAVVGRTGEIKETRAMAAKDATDDIRGWRNDLRQIQKTLNYAGPDAAGECKGAPTPLPPGGWPNCRRKLGTVEALEKQRDELECKISGGIWFKDGNTAECRRPEMSTDARIGDLGSETWAWALAPAAKRFGLDIDAPSIRKGSAVGFAVGLDVAIWSLLWLAGHLVRVSSTANGVPVSGNPPRGGKLDERQPAIAAPVETPVMAAPKVETPEERDTRLVLEALALAKRPVSNDELAGLMLVEKSEATKRRKVAEAMGAVLSERDGPFLMIRPVAAAMH